jgi:hypothetical protein
MLGFHVHSWHGEKFRARSISQHYDAPAEALRFFTGSFAAVGGGRCMDRAGPIFSSSDRVRISRFVDGYSWRST